MFQPATTGSLLAFLVICLFVVGAFLWAIWTSAVRERLNPMGRTSAVAAGTLIYLTALVVIIRSGWLGNHQPRLLFLFAAINAVSLLVGLSPIGRWLSLMPLPALIAFQGFRLPLELVLHLWVAQGVIPATMTWSGRNWDIVSGVTALFLAPLSRNSKQWAWVANLIGVTLLVNVMRVAILSSPVSFGWAVVPKLELIYHVPYALIVPVCIGGALIGHLALTRALLRPKT
jgi:hypothetical protein